MLLALGGKIDRAEVGPLPENVLAYSWLPQLQVLAKADLSINHGGIHTINECIHFGVPMLVYSGKRSDQDGCAARVHYHQVGIMADKDIDTSEEIRQKITQLLTDESYQQSIETMQLHHRRYRDEQVLENIIQEKLGQRALSST